MKSRSAGELQIGPVPESERVAALALIFGQMAPADCRQQAEAILSGLGSGEIAPEGLIGATRRGSLLGAVLSQIHPGRTALVWPPRTVPGEPVSTAERLLAAACDWLARQEVCMAQVLEEAGATADERLLHRGGFRYLGDLLYLVSQQSVFPCEPPKSSLAFEPYTATHCQRLGRLIEATYQGSLDCPGLDGLRQIDDVLAGYRATGVFDPNRWLFVRHGEQDVGCLLLADHPPQENWELVYMGVVASGRGRGWGIEITRHAQWLTRRAGRPRLVLAVDVGNEPAIRVYSAAGFSAWDRRRVHLKVLGTPPP